MLLSMFANVSPIRGGVDLGAISYPPVQSCNGEKALNTTTFPRFPVLAVVASWFIAS